MIERIEIHNWQSLSHVDLALGRLSVIVGPSSSGKTSLIRALRAVASNVRGAGHITRGARNAAITVHTGAHIVTLERTEASGCYRLVDVGTGQETLFTKLAGGVPAQITAALGIAPVPTGGTSLHVAGQFDRPYLLDDTGAAVARVLGELTNVTTILEAVREANRRRAALAATLRTREGDLHDKVSRAAAYADLPARLHARVRAEAAAETATALHARCTRLRTATEALAVADGVVDRHRSAPPLPDDAALGAAAATLHRFKAGVRAWIATTNALVLASTAAAEAERAETAAKEDLTGALRAAGRCPTCGQPTTAITTAATHGHTTGPAGAGT